MIIVYQLLYTGKNVHPQNMASISRLGRIEIGLGVAGVGLKKNPRYPVSRVFAGQSSTILLTKEMNTWNICLSHLCCVEYGAATAPPMLGHLELLLWTCLPADLETS